MVVAGWLANVGGGEVVNNDSYQPACSASKGSLMLFSPAGFSAINCCFKYFSHGYFTATRAFDKGSWFSISFVTDAADLPDAGSFSAGAVELIAHGFVHDLFKP
jgi:hypothetical protein